MSARLAWLREQVAEQYRAHPTGCGSSFDEILCWEIHENGLTFVWLARKWGISLSLLGELIADHCRGLELGPRVEHGLSRDELASLSHRERYGDGAPVCAEAPSR